MTDELPLDADDPMLELQHEYIREAPARLAELRKDVAAFRAGEPDALESLRQRFHRLAGSGGSYGFQRVTDVSRAMEHRILTPPAPTIREADIFSHAIRDLEDAFNNAATDVGLPAVLGKIPGFGWRTLLMMNPSTARDALVRSLEEVGFMVTVRTGEVDPFDVPPAERPDLVVIGTDAETDPLSLARYWSAATNDRPRAVVLADPTDQFDRLRTRRPGSTPPRLQRLPRVGGSTRGPGPDRAAGQHPRGRRRSGAIAARRHLARPDECARHDGSVGPGGPRRIGP
jgi:hypothetical protein